MTLTPLDQAVLSSLACLSLLCAWLLTRLVREVHRLQTEPTEPVEDLMPRHRARPCVMRSARPTVRVSGDQLQELLERLRR